MFLASIIILKITVILPDIEYAHWHQFRFQNVKVENVVFGQFFILIEILRYFLLFLIFLKQTFLLSDPNYSLWRQVRLNNVKAKNVVFCQFRTLIEIMTVLL